MTVMVVNLPLMIINGHVGDDDDSDGHDEDDDGKDLSAMKSPNPKPYTPNP